MMPLPCRRLRRFRISLPPPSLCHFDDATPFTLCRYIDDYADDDADALAAIAATAILMSHADGFIIAMMLMPLPRITLRWHYDAALRYCIDAIYAALFR